MDEYIKRETVLKFIENGLNNPNKLKAFGYDAIEIMTEIQYMPAADVAPVVHGRWIKPTKIGHRSFDILHCSVCDGVPCAVDENTKYCPNCGAKMDGE